MNKLYAAVFLTAAVLCVSCSKSAEEKKADATERVPMETKTEVVQMEVAPPSQSGQVTLDSSIPPEIIGSSFELGGKCGVDTINNAERVEVVSVNRRDGLNVDGWALDERLGTVPSATVLQLVNGSLQYYAILSRHGGRDDLVKEFANPLFKTAGYSASINIEKLPAAEYEILLIQKSENKNLVCPTYRKLVVKA